MYTELLKIIAGGLTGKPQQVKNYARRIAQEYVENGESRIADKITRLLTESDTQTATLDALTAKPFDQETRLATVDVTVPQESNERLFFDDLTEMRIGEFIKAYQMRNALMKKGIEANSRLLLYGPPGTGKTSLARYVSVQTGLPLVTARLDALVSSLLGDTAKNIRRVFEYAGQQPCVLFLDEFDAIAKVRDDKNELGELKRVVNSLIQNIDGFDNSSILIAATNHAQLLDNAIWRRFDTTLALSLPNDQIREELITYFAQVMPNSFMADGRRRAELVGLFKGMAPAVIKSLFNNAARNCVLAGDEQLEFGSVVLQAYVQRHPETLDDKAAIQYLLAHAVTQADTAKQLKVSLRKVREVAQKERKHGKS
ncbi:AAA family ATPase [Schleiferilactobacillus shenzhenensis]|nr:ATP-binding protein [Schleiferilactobacillus shenzhenensis]